MSKTLKDYIKSPIGKKFKDSDGDIYKIIDIFPDSTTGSTHYKIKYEKGKKMRINEGEHFNDIEVIEKEKVKKGGGIGIG